MWKMTETVQTAGKQARQLMLIILILIILSVTVQLYRLWYVKLNKWIRNSHITYLFLLMHMKVSCIRAACKRAAIMKDGPRAAMCIWCSSNDKVAVLTCTHMPTLTMQRSSQCHNLNAILLLTTICTYWILCQHLFSYFWFLKYFQQFLQVLK